MQYRQHQPCEALRPYVLCYWTLRGAVRDPQPQLVLPDGHMEIIFHLAEPFCLVKDGAALKQSEMLLAGQIWQPLVVKQSRVADVVAIRFQPGGAASFTRFPQQEVAGEVRNLEDFWGERARMVRDALGAARSMNERIRLLERLLLEMRPRLPFALDRLSPRQYRRRFEEAVGLAPKLYQRILRFQRALAVLGQRPIAEVAIECGYYDQAHLTRDFRQFAGLTPAMWLRGQQNVLFFQDAVESEAIS